MKRMKSLKAWALKVLFGMAVLCTIIFSGCDTLAGGGGTSSGGNTGGGSSDGGSGPVYVKVAYSELETYLLTKASADKVNYIEVTGVSKEDLAGKFVGSNAEAGELGKKIKAHPGKKVALKLPGKVEGLDSMFECFYGCTNLVSLAGIPSNVTDMSWCFEGCTGLTKGPVIPASVTDMAGCFYGCTSLTKAPVIPASVEYMHYCFSGCTSLTKAPDIPEGVTNMENCFEDCTKLTQGPDIPASVKVMRYCFYGCTSLTESPVIPESVTNMEGCFEDCTALKGVKLLCNYDGTDDRFKEVFKDCTALEAGGIKVKNEHYDAYTDPAALTKMAVPGDNDAAKKAKFGTF